MQLVIDVKESALDKVMYLLNHLKEDVTIVNAQERPADAFFQERKRHLHQTLEAYEKGEMPTYGFDENMDKIISV